MFLAIESKGGTHGTWVSKEITWTSKTTHLYKTSYVCYSNPDVDLVNLFLYFIYLFHLRSYLQYSLTDTYTHHTQWTSLQIKRMLSFTVITTHYYIRVALVCNVLAPFLKMDGQLITRFGNHHFELVNHLNPSV